MTNHKQNKCNDRKFLILRFGKRGRYINLIKIKDNDKIYFLKF